MILKNNRKLKQEDFKNDKELTNEILDKYVLGDILLFSTATSGAQGMPNNIEAVFKVGDTIEIYTGVHSSKENSKLTTEKVEDFFNPTNRHNGENDGWYWLNMGLGNSLCVRDILKKDYIEKYEKLVEEFPFYLYCTWRKFTEYVLNKYFNNIKYEEALNQVDEMLEEIRNDYF